MPAMATQLLTKYINDIGILDSRRNAVTKGQSQQPESLQALVVAYIIVYKTSSSIFMGEGREERPKYINQTYPVLAYLLPECFRSLNL